MHTHTCRLCMCMWLWIGSCPVSEEESRALCDRHLSDRNYYAVCRFILSPYAKHNGRSKGLLHDTPADTDAVFGISELVESCVQPTQQRQRFSAATQLMKTLTELVGDRQPTAAVKHHWACWVRRKNSCASCCLPSVKKLRPQKIFLSALKNSSAVFVCIQSFTQNKKCELMHMRRATASV